MPLAQKAVDKSKEMVAFWQASCINTQVPSKLFQKYYTLIADNQYKRESFSFSRTLYQVSLYVSLYGWYNQ